MHVCTKPTKTPTLLELAKRYKTDKAFFYAPFYEELFKGLQVRKLLEIGIGSAESMKDSIARAGWTDYQPGASLRMWQKYYPEAEIYALDNDPKLFINRGRIHSFYLEQSDVCSYIPAMDAIGSDFNMGMDFDVIIDDGSHRREDQLLALEMLFPFVRPGGLYITEDISDPDSWPYPVERFSNSYGTAALSWVRK